MFGVEPPCGSCDLPELLPQNQAVWEVFRIVAGGIGEHAGLDLMQLLARLDVRQPLPFLRKLCAVYQIARANATRNTGPS